MTPRDYLIFLRNCQREVVGYDPLHKTVAKPKSWYELVTPEVDEYFERDFRVKAEELGSYNDVLFGKLQEMIFTAIPNDLHEEIAIGELFLSYPQAFIFKCKDKGYAIGIHTHLCNFLRFLTVTAETRVRLDSGLLTRMKREEIYSWFVENIAFYLLHKGNLPTMPDPVNKADLIITEMVFTTALLWIVCHEYGHYLRGHLQKAESFSPIKIANQEVMTFKCKKGDEKAWKEEYIADIEGTELLLRAINHKSFRVSNMGDLSKEDKFKYASWGIDMAIAMLSIIDRRYILFTKREFKHSTHPPAHLRLQNLAKHRPALFKPHPIMTIYISGYFDAIFKDLPGTMEVREP